jgi:hypothetical protein
MRGWLLRAVLRFFGVSSPAVLLMALLSYFGFRTPVPDAPSDSPEAIAQRAKQIIESVSTAKSKLKETLSSFGSQDEIAAKTPAKRPANDDELVNVTYEELFDDPTPVAQPKRPGTPIPLDRPPAKISDNRDKKKSKDGGFPDLSPNPYR